MKLSNICCPNCGGTINADVSKQKTIFCTYCGHQLEVDNGVSETVYTKNININKNVNIHERYTNDADVIRENNKMKETKQSNVVLIVLFIFILGLMIFGFSMAYIPKIIGEAEGKICAGFHRDLEGKNYQYVKSTLEAAGFSNIELIELNDEDFFNKDGDVSSVSVGGNTSFDSSDYFDKDAKIVITYH